MNPCLRYQVLTNLKWKINAILAYVQMINITYNVFWPVNLQWSALGYLEDIFAKIAATLFLMKNLSRFPGDDLPLDQGFYTLVVLKGFEGRELEFVTLNFPSSFDKIFHGHDFMLY